MNSLREKLLKWPKWVTTSLASLAAVLIGVLDYATGFELQITAFYLFPICWACWSAGRRAGRLLALAAAIISAGAELASGRVYLHPWLPLWNAGMLSAVFWVAVEALAAFLDAHRDLVAAQASLRVVNEGLEKTVEQRTAALKAEVEERERIQLAKIQTERLLERREKLAVLGTLTAGIAHEIRNPLTSIKARLYTLDKHLGMAHAARKDTEIISAEISRLERVVKDALSFARPADPRFEPVNCRDLLREVQGLMSQELENRGVQFLAESGPDLIVNADTGHLKQVLINLIRNGSEAIQGDGKITLRARAERVTLSGRETDGVVVEVSDTGRGIPPEVEKRLFDPFFTTKDSGTGIGLSIAARIVERHGGVIQHHTSLGNGTTFQIILPAAAKE